MHGKKKNPIATVRRSRLGRSISRKKGKKAKKAKNLRKRRKGKKATKRKNTKQADKDINMSDEGQPLRFNETEKDRIVKAISGTQYDGSFAAFKNVSEAIRIATGVLPNKFIPYLQNLSASYSVTSKKIKIGFADSSALLSKFVIKTWRSIERGISKEDMRTLVTLGNELNTDFTNELTKFVDLAITDLVIIYSQLLFETADDKIKNLLKERDELEIDVFRRSKALANKSSELGRIQGEIDSIKYQKQIYELTIQDSKAAKLELREELLRLKGQIPDYQSKIQQHRDNCSVERGSFGVFSWKVRDVCIDNGERIARENLNRLLDQIRLLENKLNNRSSQPLTKEISTAKRKLFNYERNKTKLENEHKNLTELYEQAQQKFLLVIQRIEKVYRSTGTTNFKSILAVGQLSQDLRTGSEALIRLCGKIRTHLASIAVDPISLVDTVIYALQLINMADEYNDSTKIKDIKRVLALE